MVGNYGAVKAAPPVDRHRPLYVNVAVVDEHLAVARQGSRRVAEMAISDPPTLGGLPDRSKVPVAPFLGMH